MRTGSGCNEHKLLDYTASAVKVMLCNEGSANTCLDGGGIFILFVTVLIRET